jgi:tetratricopeptide (TPR) repeat protein
MAIYNEAHSVLSNDKKRADYDASLDAGKTGTIEDKRNQVDASAIFHADTSFRRGQQALERGQIPKARDLFESAFKGNPGSGEYEVYYKYCVALDDKLTDSARRKIMDEIDILANKASSFDMAFYFLGELHIKNKNPDRAKACFQKALALNSKNFMASRQLRLLTMRDNSSFMDKLKSMFKK